jgi:hypothetical protein
MMWGYGYGSWMAPVVMGVTGVLVWILLLAGAVALLRWSRPAGRAERDAELPGLVLHATTFPGWENVSGLLEHLRFVAGHRGRVQRVALVVPGPGIDLAAGVVGAVLHPEVRRFTDLQDAVRWAAHAPERVG